MELRKRLAEQAGVTLPATVAFDVPTPRAIARLLCKPMDLPVASDQEQALKLALSRLSVKQLEEAGLLDRILQLVNRDSVRVDEPQKSEPEVAVEDMSLTDIQDELRSKMQSFVEDE